MTDEYEARHEEANQQLLRRFGSISLLSLCWTLVQRIDALEVKADEAFAEGFKHGIAEAKAGRIDPLAIASGQPTDPKLDEPPPDYPAHWRTTAYHPNECAKVFHGSDQPYNHGDGDDGPYQIGHDIYCGRCHAQIGGVSGLIPCGTRTKPRLLLWVRGLTRAGKQRAVLKT